MASFYPPCFPLSISDFDVQRDSGVKVAIARDTSFSPVDARALTTTPSKWAKTGRS
jgi:hypothetical protein